MSKLIAKTEPKQSNHLVLNKPYVRRLLPDLNGGFTASIQEFPGLVAEGETPDEALKNLDEAAKSWIAVALANGREIREPIEFNGYSGKIALRIPRSLHQQAAELAELEGVSINHVLTLAIANYTAGKKSLLEATKIIKNEFEYFLAPINQFHWYATQIQSLKPYAVSGIGLVDTNYTVSLTSNNPKQISGVKNG